jgi:hypothetical protein
VTRAAAAAAALALALALAAGGAPAREIDGVEVAETLDTGDVQLVLNGAGMRTRLFIDIYVAGLYLAGPTGDARAILAADGPMAMRMILVSSLVTPARLRRSIADGFDRSTGGHPEPFRTEMEALVAAFRDDVGPGDVFDLVWVPGSGLEIRRNGALLTRVPSGPGFERALFGIWLGEDPVQQSLKRGLLGH